MTEQRMRNACCWISTAADKLRMHRAYCFSTSMVTRTRPGVTFAVCLIQGSLALLGSRLKCYKHSSTLECVLCASSITLCLL